MCVCGERKKKDEGRKILHQRVLTKRGGIWMYEAAMVMMNEKDEMTMTMYDE